MSRPRRALLFMPGDDLRKIAKGASLGIDSIIMDLEDGVAAGRKDAARATVVEALAALDFGASERLVRLNSVGSGLVETDIAATVDARPDGYVLPKVESGDNVRWVCDLLSRAEADHRWPAHNLRLIAIVETARGILRLDDIAQAAPRLDALAFGAEDMAGDIGATRSRDGWEVFHARSAVVIAAAAYGLQALDTPWVDLSDLAGLADDARRAAAMGYSGKLAIHPRHVPVIIDAFTPAPDEIAAAQRLLTAYHTHQAAGTGVFALDGKMVDAPMLRAAQRLLARAGIDAA